MWLHLTLKFLLYFAIIAIYLIPSYLMFKRSLLLKVKQTQNYTYNKYKFILPFSLSTMSSFAHATANVSPGETTSPIIIEEPLTDTRLYETFRLPNGIKTILVHDRTSEKAAAALSVQAGAMQDPEDYSGLAHFTGLFIINTIPMQIIFITSHKYIAVAFLFLYNYLYNNA